MGPAGEEEERAPTPPPLAAAAELDELEPAPPLRRSRLKKSNEPPSARHAGTGSSP